MRFLHKNGASSTSRTSAGFTRRHGARPAGGLLLGGTSGVVQTITAKVIQDLTGLKPSPPVPRRQPVAAAIRRRELWPAGSWSRRVRCPFGAARLVSSAPGRASTSTSTSLARFFATLNAKNARRPFPALLRGRLSRLLVGDAVPRCRAERGSRLPRRLCFCDAQEAPSCA